MASTITLKRRITSIKNTRQITKAMELVSASKLRRAQEYALRSRAYRDLAYDLLARLNAMPRPECVETSLALTEAPLANTGRYDSLRGAVEANHA